MKRPTNAVNRRRNSNGAVLSAAELLEARQMLASDMLVSVYDDTGGLSVLRYDDTFTPVAGGVATSTSVAAVQGLAVAPDNTFYVSSPISAQVFHYDSDGTLLGALGAGDATAAPLQVPGSLAFGPNGNLYVADLGAAAIFQFDTAAVGQQYQAADTLSLGYVPGGFDFETDGDLVVGDLYFQGLNHYDSMGNLTVWIEQFSGINPAAVLVRPDGDVLIGDITLGNDPLDHHQVVLYDVSEDTTSQFINLTTPVGTGDFAGDPPQPGALEYDENGDLLVGLSPDHNLNGAIQKYDPDSGAFIQTLVSGIGTPTGIGFVPSQTPVDTVISKHLFYNQSVWDANSAAIDPVNDAAAIAPDKTPYVAGSGVATFDNISSYSRGINGIMIDLSTAAIHAGITASDFVFKVGNDNSPTGWAAAPAPSAVSVVMGGGDGGGDRIIVTWPNGSITNTWLEVQLLATANTGLAEADVHFWGNKIADSGTSTPATTFSTTTTDSIQVFATLGAGKPITDLRDYNRDGQVSTTDSLIVFSSLGSITRIDIPGAGPFAPVASPAVAFDDRDQAVASALSLLAEQEAAPVIQTTFSERHVPISSRHALRERLFAELASTRLGRSFLTELTESGEPDSDDQPSDLLGELVS